MALFLSVFCYRSPVTIYYNNQSARTTRAIRSFQSKWDKGNSGKMKDSAIMHAEERPNTQRLSGRSDMRGKLLGFEGRKAGGR
jgi:hypothetical protein